MPFSQTFPQIDISMYHQEKSGRHSKRNVTIGALSTLITIGVLASWSTLVNVKPSESFNDIVKLDYCPKLLKLVPEESSQLLSLSDFHSEAYKNYSLSVWQDAIKIYTPSFDDLGAVGKDKRWEVFFEFEKYLKQSFPAVHEFASLEHVNLHGLVYHIKGSDASLKPIMLTGHQDVVPVPPETINRWTYPPFEAYFDGKFVWGRGSSDCKNNVIGIFEALEQLFTHGFKPKRGIVVALGFDEESSGKEGAEKIGQYLLRNFGEKSFFSIIDEGGLGIQDFYGTRFALPSTGEKGYVDIFIDLVTQGGHSSVPPKHTGIGIISHLVTLIESYDYSLDITDKNPFFYQLQCEAKFGATIDHRLKSDLLNIGDPKSKKRALDILATDGTTRALLSTTQAVDIIHGGLKINALPEKVTLKINHRVGYDSSIKEVKDRITSLVLQVADLYGLGVQAFEETLKDAVNGQFTIISDSDLDPAPLTSTIGNPTWDILGGTIKHVFEDFANFSDHNPEVDPEVIVAPSCMTGNTDTKHYWKLSENIYRFTPIQQEKRLNAHAIDERVQLDAHIEGVVFYHQFIRNADSYE